jgi:uncharacterized protein involved in outer membrane biogenesis
VQHTLLALALLVIAALVAALAAPAYVDWNQWRPMFEQRAGALLGAPVRIRGPIAATLLPTPTFTLSDVELGPEGRALRAGAVRAIVSLGPLLRGQVEAEEFVLQRPTLRVVLESGGRISAPLAMPRGGDQIAISRIRLEDGALVIEDRVGGTTHVLSELSASGELRSLAGPFRIEGGARLGERRWNARVSMGRIGGDAAGRLRLSVEAQDGGAALEADGTLALGEVPQFEGRASLSLEREGHRARIGGNVRASTALLVLEGLQLSLDGADPPIELAGRVRVEPPVRYIDVALSAKRLDLDRTAANGNAPRDFSAARRTILEALPLLTALGYSGRVGLSAESVAAGAGLLREAQVELALRGDLVGVERLEARLPGRGLLRALGRSDGRAVFAGEVVLEAEEPGALLRWLSGVSLVAVEPVRLAGRLSLVRGMGADAQRIAFEAALARAEGLGDLVQGWLGDGDATAVARRAITSLVPLELTGNVAPAAGGGHVINMAARLHDVDATLRARIDAAAASPISESRLVLAASDARRLGALFGLAPGDGARGEARLELAAAGPRDGALAVVAQLIAPGINVGAQGDVRRNSNGLIEPDLRLRLEASDLRALAARLSRLGHALPAWGAARLVRGDGGFAFDEIDVTVAGSRVRGRLAFSALEPLALSGRLALEQADLSALVGLALGAAEPPKAGYWSEAPLGVPLLEGASGAIEFEVAKLTLAGGVSADEARFILKLGAPTVTIQGLAASLAGGRLRASAEFVRGQSLGLDARVALAGADVASLLAAARLPPGLRGKGDLHVALSASGRTLAALAASAAGQGMVVLERLEVARLDPGAIASALSTAQGPTDPGRAAAALAVLFARGSLVLPKFEAPVTVTGGSARLRAARETMGPVQVSAQASLDLVRLSFDAAVELELSGPAGSAARPGAIVRWRGPLSAPERAIDAAALSNAIALRAVEREMGEIEKRDTPKPPLDAPSVMVDPLRPITGPAAPVPPSMIAPPVVRVPAPVPGATPQRNEPAVGVPALPPPPNVRPPPGAVRP